MLNLISIVFGGVSLILVALAFLPLLGWANWLILPLPILGALIGMVSRGKLGRNLNLAAYMIGIVRLSLGGGVF
jgi:hypothetical protein